MDLTLILDLSGSLASQKELVLAFARRLASGLNMQRDRVRVAAVAFATDILSRLVGYRNFVLATLEFISGWVLTCDRAYSW